MGDDRSWLFYVQWVPAFSLYRGLWEMSEYTVRSGLEVVDNVGLTANLGGGHQIAAGFCILFQL